MEGLRRRGACERVDKHVGKRHAEVAGASERQNYRTGEDKITDLLTGRNM